MSVSSLFDLSLQKVMRDIKYHEAVLRYLPSLVKTKVATVMAKRGLLTDCNLPLVLHDGVTDLDLSECTVSGAGLGIVWSFCPRLRRIDLSAPQQGVRNSINSRTFCQFFTHCPKLKVVSLRWCVLVDNAAVAALVSSCPMLTSLCVAGCHMVSDRSLVAIGQKCKYLQALDLARTKVSLEGIAALATGVGSKILKELNISHCLNVTDEAIEALVTNCSRLTILVFHSCPLLSGHSRELAGRVGLKQLTWTVY